jgi:hypothetical protein
MDKEDALANVDEDVAADAAAEGEAAVVDPDAGNAEFGDAFDEFAKGDGPADDASDKPVVKELDTEDKPVHGDEPAAEATEPTVDIWVDATPEQKAAHEAALEGAHKWQSDQGRQIADRTKIAALEKQIAETPADAGDDAVSTESVFGGEDWKTVSEELPELAAPLQRLFQSNEAKSAALEKELAAFSDERRTQVYDTQFNIALDAHPDLVAVTNDPAFVEWAGGQPAFVQQMIGRNAENIIDGAESAHVVGLFKLSDRYTAPVVTAQPAAGEAKTEPAAAAKPAATTKHDRAKARRLEANVSAPAKGPGAASGAPEDYDGAFDHYAAQPT